MLILYSSQRGRQSLRRDISWAMLFALHRIALRWNQTGQKYAGSPDIVHDLLIRFPPILWVLVIVTYATVAARLTYHLLRDLKVDAVISSTIATGLCIPALIFKLGFTASDAPELLDWLGQSPTFMLQDIPLILTARLTFVSLALTAASVAAAKYFIQGHQKKPPLPSLHDLLTLFLLTQTRAHNVPLYLLFILQHNSLRRADLTTTQATLSTILFGHVSFFALGNSNAISSIDLSNAYNGVSGYNVGAVGLLVLISNWAGPIWWSVAGIKLLAELVKVQELNQSKSNGGVANRTRSHRAWISKEHEELAKSAADKSTSASTEATQAPSPLFSYIALWTLFTSSALLAVMASCTILRAHLFIWTVFSPKYLYSMAWTLGFQLLVVISSSWALWNLAAVR